LGRVLLQTLQIGNSGEILEQNLLKSKGQMSQMATCARGEVTIKEPAREGERENARVRREKPHDARTVLGISRRRKILRL
jgi:hypothetical protein